MCIFFSSEREFQTSVSEREKAQSHMFCPSVLVKEKEWKREREREFCQELLFKNVCQYIYEAFCKHYYQPKIFINTKNITY